MSYGNYVPSSGYKLFAKSSNYGSVANFSSTIDDAHLLLVANNCNNIFYNDQHNAAVIGATSTITENGPFYESYIGIKKAGNTEKVALFDTNEIHLHKNTIISGDLLPSSNIEYNLGNSNYRWKDLFLSGNTINMTNTDGQTQTISAGIDGFEMKDNNNNHLPVIVKTVTIPGPIQEDGSSSYFNLGVDDDGKTKVTSFKVPQDVDGNSQPPEIMDSVSLSEMNTNTMIEGSNLFFTWQRTGLVAYSSNQETSNYINTKIANLNLDNIADGATNRFIVNNVYDTELVVKGMITASNLTVLGETTTVETVEYLAEKLHIVHDDYDGPSLRLDHHTDITDEVFSTWKYDSENENYKSLMMIKSINNMPKIGVGNENPQHSLDITGDIFTTGDVNISNLQTRGNIITNDIIASNFVGSGEKLNSVNLLDRNTDLLAEGTGSNFYYTNERKDEMLNYIGDVLNGYATDVDNRTLDSIYQGGSNKYVVNNIYDGDLYVAGKLLVTGIDIVDMEYIIAQEGSTESFGNVFGVINDVTSNLVTEKVQNTSNEIINYVNNSVSDTAFWNYSLDSTDTIATDSFSVENLPFKQIVTSEETEDIYRRIYDITLITYPDNADESITLFSGIINIVYNKIDQVYTLAPPITINVQYSYFRLNDLTISNNTIKFVDSEPIDPDPGVTEVTLFEIIFDDNTIAQTYTNNNINISELAPHLRLSLIAR